MCPRHYMRVSIKFYQRVSNYFFLNEGRDDSNTTKSGSSSPNQRFARPTFLLAWQLCDFLLDPVQYCSETISICDFSGLAGGIDPAFRRSGSMSPSGSAHA